MKKINVLQLIASLCMLFGCVINLLDLCIGLPFAVRVCATPLLIAALVLYIIVLRNQMKNKKK